MSNKLNKNCIEIFTSFIKVGTVGFGGGSALIPIVERELVEEKKLMKEEDFLKHTVIANITPGALPVKLGATCGHQLGGVWGSILGAYGVMLPGVMITVVIMALFSTLGAQAVQYFNYASVGISAFIIYLLLNYIRKTVNSGQIKTNLLLCLGAFVLTGGAELRHIIGAVTGLSPSYPLLFDISTIDLMLISFFMIILVTAQNAKPFLLSGVALCGLYAVFAGKYGKAAGLYSQRQWLLLCMLLMLCAMFFLSRKRGKTGFAMRIPKVTLLEIGIFIAVPAILAAITQFVCKIPSAIPFITDVCLSTVTSFGGGEAYISVADGIFVGGGFIPQDVFYTRLVPVANALPGPILVKVASGIGYVFGEGNHPWAGWLMAATAATAAAGICSSFAVFVMCIYDYIKDSSFVKGLKKYMLPVICGMLLSTSCAMLFESMKIITEKGISGMLALPVVAGWVAFLFILTKRRHINDLLLLFASALISVLCFLAV